jgi:hypothetical protein
LSNFACLSADDAGNLPKIPATLQAACLAPVWPDGKLNQGRRGPGTGMIVRMDTWTAKTLSIALMTFVAAYIGFFILCFVAYASSANAEPVPALLVGIPVGAIAAGIVVIVRLALRNSW